MSRVPFGIEKGLAIYTENGDVLSHVLSGTAAPDGLGDQGLAPIGSLYIRSGTAELYQKIANAGNSADWELNGSSSATIGSWRPEQVLLVTNDTQGAGTRDVVANPFADDNTPALTISDYTVGKYIISDADGTPALLQITAIAGDDVTFAVAANALVDGNAFITKNYLPNAPGTQEREAIVVYSNGVMVKIADVTWNFADGISLATGYAAQNGNISSADTVNSAVEKLDGNQQDIQTTLGVAQGAVNLGTFAGATIPDNQTIKQALQAVETAYEETDVNVNDLITLSGVVENSTDLGTFTGATIPDASTVKGALQSLETAHEEVDQNVNDLITAVGIAENATDFGTFTGGSLADAQTAKQLFQRIEVLLEQMRGVQAVGVTAITTIDSVPTADVKACKWLVEVVEIATPANRQALEVYALTNGTLVDDTVYAKLKIGSNFNFSLTVDVNAGNMRLRAASTSAGVTVTARRIEVVKSVL